VNVGDEYTCDRCGRTFLTDRSAEEALAECERVFGFVPAPDDRAVICDDCNAEFVAWARERGLIARLS
jgi:hypothetical protein